MSTLALLFCEKSYVMEDKCGYIYSWLMLQIWSHESARLRRSKDAPGFFMSAPNGQAPDRTGIRLGPDIQDCLYRPVLAERPGISFHHCDGAWLCCRIRFKSFSREYSFRYNRRNSEVHMFHHFMAQVKQLAGGVLTDKRGAQIEARNFTRFTFLFRQH